MKKIITLFITVCMLLTAVATLASCGHKHTFSTEWSKDDTNHWHVCEDEECTEIADSAAHTWGEPTVTEAKERVFTCTVCGQTKTEVIKTTVTAEEWTAAMDLGTNWTIKADVTVADQGASMSMQQSRDGDKFHMKQSYKEGDSGEEDSYEMYAEIAGDKWINYRYDEDLKEFTKTEDSGTVEENLADFAEEYLPDFVRNAQDFTYDEAKKAYVAATITTEDLGNISNCEVFFEDGKLVSFSCSIDMDGMMLAYDFTFTYGDTSLTLPTVDDSKIAYKVYVIDTANGGQVAGVRIQACKGKSCLTPVVTNENGVAVFRLDKNEDISQYHVKLNKLPDGYTGDTAQEYTFPEDSSSLYIFISAATAE